MSEQQTETARTARIIQFPRARLPLDQTQRGQRTNRTGPARLAETDRATGAVGDIAPADRLARALQSLDEALAGQRVAVADWRSALKDLGQSVQDLKGGVLTYAAALSQLEPKTAALSDEAARMGSWADAAIAAKAHQAPGR